MSDASTRKPHVGGDPPEGEHFEFTDHGGELVLTVRSIPNWWHMLPVSVLVFAFMVCMFKWLALPAGVPWPFLAVASVIAAIGGAGFLWLLLDSVIGFEAMHIDTDTIRITHRTLLPTRRELLCRRDAYDLRVLRESRNLGPFRLSGYSREFGKIGITHRGTAVRFGTPLTEDEATAVCAFVLSKCPDLGPRA